MRSQTEDTGRDARVTREGRTGEAARATENASRLTALGRAAVYFYCRGDERLAGAILERLVHEATLREAARAHRVERHRLARRTGEFLELMRVFVVENGMGVGEFVEQDSEQRTANSEQPEDGLGPVC